MREHSADRSPEPEVCLCAHVHCACTRVSVTLGEPTVGSEDASEDLLQGCSPCHEDPRLKEPQSSQGAYRWLAHLPSVHLSATEQGTQQQPPGHTESGRQPLTTYLLCGAPLPTGQSVRAAGQSSLAPAPAPGLPRLPLQLLWTLERTILA